MSSAGLTIRLKVEPGRDYTPLSKIDKDALKIAELFGEEFSTLAEFKERISETNYYVPEKETIRVIDIPQPINSMPVYCRMKYSFDRIPEVARIKTVLEPNGSSQKL
jgi:hypothetical protein